MTIHSMYVCMYVCVYVYFDELLILIYIIQAILLMQIGGVKRAKIQRHSLHRGGGSVVHQVDFTFISVQLLLVIRVATTTSTSTTATRRPPM